MAAAANAPVTWHRQVGGWIQAVVTQKQRFFHQDLRSAAGQFVFPSNPGAVVLRWFSKALAQRLLQWVIRSAAQDIGVDLSAEEVAILADVATAAL